eukprot:3393266-Prymnesium_polylepis.1
MAGLAGALTLLGGEQLGVADVDARADARRDHTLVIHASIVDEITGAVLFPNGILHPAGGVTEWSAPCCSHRSPTPLK